MREYNYAFGYRVEITFIFRMTNYPMAIDVNRKVILAFDNQQRLVGSNELNEAGEYIYTHNNIFGRVRLVFPNDLDEFIPIR